MGVIPSQTSYYTLPSNAIRICHGGHDGRCFCNGGYHRKEKYVYVDRRSDGRERYHDMMELMGKFMMGQGGGGSMTGAVGTGGAGNMGIQGGGGIGQGVGAGMGWPFRDAREWTIRDYDRLGDVMKEFYDRERGRGRWAPGEHNGGGAGGMCGPPMMAQMGGMYPGMMPGMNPQMMYMGMNMPMGAPGTMPPPQGPDPYSTSSRGPQHQHQHPSMEEFQRLQQDLEEKFREYNRHMGVLFGTEQDRQKDQHRATMLKTLQEIMPQLAQMMAQQAAMGTMRGGVGMNPMMGGMPQGMMSQGMMPPQMQNPMAYGPPNPAMMGQTAPPQMQSPYNQGQGYYNDPILPRRPYRRKRWQDRYDDGDAFCSDTEQRRTTPWDSHAHHGPAGGRFGRRGVGDDDMFDGEPGGATPSRPKPSGPFDGPRGGPGLGDTFAHPRADRFASHPPPVTTMGMGDTMPPSMSGALHSHSPHLGRSRPMDTQPPFPTSRPGLARSNTAFRHSHLDPDLAAGPSGANVRINIDPQIDAGAGAFDGGFVGGMGRSSVGGGGFGRSSMGDVLGPRASAMGTAVGMQGMGAGYVPETTKLSRGRDVEERRDEADAGQGIVDHTGR